MTHLVLNNKNIWGYLKLWFDILDKDDESNKSILKKLKNAIKVYRHMDRYKDRLAKIQEDIDNG